MSNDIKTRLAKEILDLKWDAPTTDVMRGWNMALDTLVEYKLTNDIEKVIRCKDCIYHTEDNECANGRWDNWSNSEYGLYPEALDMDYCSYGERNDD